MKVNYFSIRGVHSLPKQKKKEKKKIRKKKESKVN